MGRSSKKPEKSRKNGTKRILVRSQGSSSGSAVQQALIGCSNRIKIGQKPRKIEAFRGFLIPKQADMAGTQYFCWVLFLFPEVTTTIPALTQWAASRPVSQFAPAGRFCIARKMWTCCQRIFSYGRLSRGCK